MATFLWLIFRNRKIDNFCEVISPIRRLFEWFLSFYYFFYLKTEKIQLLKRCDFIYILDEGQNPRIQFYWLINTIVRSLPSSYFFCFNHINFCSMCWLPGKSFDGFKTVGREVVHSPSVADIKEAWSFRSTTPYVLAWWLKLGTTLPFHISNDWNSVCVLHLLSAC